MNHVFISYSRQDSDVVFDIIKRLKNAGVKIWIDQQNIEPGVNWDSEIERGIRDSSVILAFLSESSINSQNNRDEWARGMDNGKPIIPVVISANLSGTTPFQLSNLKKLEINDDKLLDSIIELLPEQVKLKKTENHEASDLSPIAKGYIFISYSIEDVEFTLKIRQFLAEKGYAYWDYQESYRKYDMPFHLEIEGAIKDASAVISVVSPGWKASKWATREYLFSEQISKTNFVCIVRDVGPTLLYADKTFIEFFNDEEKGFDTLDKALRREGLID